MSRLVEAQRIKLLDPEEREKHRARVQDWERRVASDPVRSAKRQRQLLAARLKRKYGLSIEDYDRMLVEQHHRCAICGGGRDVKKGWHVDHCHVSGRVRGLLCHRCNAALGFIREDEASAIAMANYIRERCAIKKTA